MFSQNLTPIWSEDDEGIIINGIENYSNWEEIVEKKFINYETGFEIYYTGAWYRGEGIFWIIVNGNRVNILKRNIRYGPRIKWHGENIAEIHIPTGSPFTHSYYYDFSDNTLSEPYPFPIYYDIDNNFVLIWGNEDFEL